MNRMDDSGMMIYLSEFKFIHVIASNGEYDEIVSLLISYSLLYFHIIS